MGSDASMNDSVNVDQVKAQLQQQVAAQIMERKIETINETCFAKCVTTPSTRLSTSEQRCLSQCFDRYWDTMQVVVKAVQSNSTQRRPVSMRRASGCSVSGALLIRTR